MTQHYISLGSPQRVTESEVTQWVCPRLTWGNRLDQSRWHRDCPRSSYLARDGHARARGPAYFYRRPCDHGFQRHHHRFGSTYLKRQHSNAGGIRRRRYALRSDGY